MSTDDLFAWEDARRLADELEVDVYLASMDTRDHWHRLEKRLCKLARIIARSDEHIGEMVVRELHQLRAALRALRDEVSRSTSDDLVKSW